MHAITQQLVNLVKTLDEGTYWTLGEAWEKDGWTTVPAEVEALLSPADEYAIDTTARQLYLDDTMGWPEDVIEEGLVHIVRNTATAITLRDHIPATTFYTLTHAWTRIVGLPE